MSVMHVMGDRGDIEVHWTKDDAQSVETARAEWKALRDSGFEFYLPEQGGRGKRVKNFKPEFERVIAAPGVSKTETGVARRPGHTRTQGTPARSRAMAGGPRARRAT